MIIRVDSLEEAIEYVKDPDVKEELTYQYRKIIPRLDAFERITSLEDDLENLSYDKDSLQDNYDLLENRVFELEDIEEKFNLIKNKLIGCCNEISTSKAEQYLNEILSIFDEEPIKIHN